MESFQPRAGAALVPRSEAEVEAMAREAIARDCSLAIAGHGTRRAMGPAVSAVAAMDLSALGDVIAYEPEELVLTVQAGAPLAAIDDMLARRGQELAFEPMRPQRLLGLDASRGTVGGMIAAGFAGPRRVKAGGVRDHILGAHAVSGFGEAFKTGGRVVKNVTGYDLAKLLAGSWGTLAIMTQATFKVLPRAERETTLVLAGLDEPDAGRAMVAALGSSCDVSGAAHLPAGQAARLKAADVGGAATLLRIEGIAASVAERARVLETVLAPFGPALVLMEEASRAVWSDLRDVAPLGADTAIGAWPVWRIIAPPAAGLALGASLARDCGAAPLYDWGGGLIWAAMPPAREADALAWFDRHLPPAGAHARRVRGLGVNGVVRPAPTAGIAALEGRIKRAFDPRGLLNPPASGGTMT